MYFVNPLNISDKELFELCRQYGREARKWKCRFVALLPEVYKRRLYRRKGYGSIFEFAAKMGGVSKNVVEEVIRFDEKFEDMPKLKSLISDIGLSKLRSVASVAKKETDSFWAEKVQNMTRGALEVYIKDIRPGTEAPGNSNLPLFDEENDASKTRNLKTQNGNKSTFSVQLDEETIFQLQLLKKKFEKEKGEALCWNDVMKMSAKKLLHVAPKRKYKTRPSKSRQVPARKRREQPKKCIAPGCNKPAVIIHHPERYALTKTHDRLASLCKAHHELAHRGYLDEKTDFKTLIRPIIDPIKAAIDTKMLTFLRGP